MEQHIGVNLDSWRRLISAPKTTEFLHSLKRLGHVAIYMATSMIVALGGLVLFVELMKYEGFADYQLVRITYLIVLLYWMVHFAYKAISRR